MKKKVLLLLNGNQNGEIIRYREMLTEYDIVGVILPSGLGFSGKDCCCLDGGLETGLAVSATVDYNQDIDGIIIDDKTSDVAAFEAIKEYVCDIIAHNVQIYFLYQPTDEIRELCFSRKAVFSVISDDNTGKIINERISEIQTPIVLVCGLHEYTHKFSIQLEIYKQALEMGYKPLIIGSKAFTGCFSGFSVPRFMFSEISEREKILSFNKYVKEIEKEHNPDLLVIGVPGGIAPFNEHFPGYFGITMYEIMQSITPDAIILSCLYENYNKEYFEELRKKFFYTYGVDIDCFNLSPFYVDVNESEQSGHICYAKMNIDEVERIKVQAANDIPLYNISNGSDGCIMSKSILETLSDYSDAEIV